MATKSKTSKTVSKSAANTADETIETKTQNIVPKDVDLNQYITVKNGFHGMLVYKSSKTGELFEWDSFGSEQEMELRELKSAKNSAKSFFINNWFMFDDEYAWVIDYLGLRQYYKHFLSVDNFDDIFKKTPQQLKAAIAELSAGQKSSLMYRAYELISDGTLDSIKQINAIEEALGIELIEK